ncbi:hypothetical protein AMJ40_01870 [candidate division TA06 bacterium DG_26]|uniref:Uncharacterized protein n=1 Tax=candidate division TA06 bacterium DG_26 TaxID=1703771 RepID=A0A0S7WKL0_UNCT6|nr:MAG: hypothetical protein AMJ40_01870 [candidate division TA06 bacterium DG_26]
MKRNLTQRLAPLTEPTGIPSLDETRVRLFTFSYSSFSDENGPGISAAGYATKSLKTYPTQTALGRVDTPLMF